MRAEILAIAESASAPTFGNTVEALEGAGRAYDRVTTLFSIYTSAMNTSEIQALEREWSPKFASLHDEIVQNQKLFQRLETLYERRNELNLDEEQKRLLWVHYTNFVRSGAKLDSTKKTQLSRLNQELAQLYTQFSQNLLADEEQHSLVLTKEEELAGLPESFRRGVAQDGKWVIRNTRSSMEPFLTYSGRRDLREKGWRMWVSRGDNGDATDNNKIASRVLVLRAQRAKLLGYPTHAHWQLENAMAKNPDNAMELMLKVWKPAVARVREEVADMEAIAGHSIEPWDYRFYAEKVRKQKYDLDASEIKPYLQLENMRKAQFWAAQKLFGLTFTRGRRPARLPHRCDHL